MNINEIENPKIKGPDTESLVVCNSKLEQGRFWQAVLTLLLALAANLLQAQTVSLVLSNDPAIMAPSYMGTDGTNLFVTGVSPDNSQNVFLVSPLGGAATLLYSAYNPYQITFAGTNIYWIDPNSGPIGDTQIHKAAANGSGLEPSIYTGSNVGQPIWDGSGMASDGILLYAGDEVAGTVWRMNFDG